MMLKWARARGEMLSGKGKGVVDEKLRLEG